MDTNGLGDISETVLRLMGSQYCVYQKAYKITLSTSRNMRFIFS